MVSKRVIFGAFLFLVSSNFLYFGGVFNKTIIPFALVGYEIGYSQLGPAGLVGCLPSNLRSGVPLFSLQKKKKIGTPNRRLFTISYPMRAHGIIVNDQSYLHGNN